MAFEVGAFVEAYWAKSPNDSKWCIHEIVEVDDDDDIITIKANGGWHLQFDKTSKALAPLNTHTVNCTLLSNVSIYKNEPYQLIYCKYLNTILTMTDNGFEYYDESTADEWNCISIPIDYLFQFVFAIDNTHHKIYVVRDDILTTENNIKILDLNSMEWNDLAVNASINDPICKEKIVKVIYINEALNKLHAFTEEHQYQYNQQSNGFEKVSDLPLGCISDQYIIYSELAKKIILLGGLGNDALYELDIYYCDIDSNQTEFEWKKYNKFRMGAYSTTNILIYDHIIVGLSSSSSTIDVMDFLFDIRFSYKPSKALSYLYQNRMTLWDDNTNDEYDSFFAAITNENYIHVVDSDQHFKFNLSDILSNDVRSFYKKQYELFIFGYIKDVQKANEIKYHFPFYLSKLILSFYPTIC